MGLVVTLTGASSSEKLFSREVFPFLFLFSFLSSVYV